MPFLTELAQVSDKTVDSGPSPKGGAFSPPDLLNSFNNIVGNQLTHLNDGFSINFGTANDAMMRGLDMRTNRGLLAAGNNLGFLNGFEIGDCRLPDGRLQLTQDTGERVETGDQPKSPDQIMFDAIRAKMEELAKKNEFSGQLVITRGGEQIFTHSTGWAERAIDERSNDVPINENTRMPIGSIGKMFTALAIMQLFQQGRLSLNSTLADFNTGFPNPERAARITIEQLLTHQAGLGDPLTDDFIRQHRSHLHTVDDYIQRFGEGPELEQNRFKYSNYGYMLLGKIVEQASGQSFDEYVRDKIFGPAGMTSTDLLRLSDIPGGARPYHSTDGLIEDVEILHPPVPTPAGGMFSTAADMARFMEAFKNGELLGMRYVDMMTTGHVNSDQDDPNARYGYGMMIDQTNGVRTFGHSGGFEGTAAVTTVFPDSNYTYTIISNMTAQPGSGENLPTILDDMISRRK